MLRNISIGVLLAMAAMLGSYGVAAATLRCGSAIVSEGDLIDDVLRKCGNPDSRKIEGPAVDGSGYIVRGAATVENWVYGPRNGWYQKLRFVDGRLVQIKGSMD
ncbi:TPA: DUF2845 domain-containing protein [Pseudomonas aeruginosa]|jgi:hypothetical protein|uniref:Uncharacterized protein n=9 Tax=Pseudomonadota TaxID=1224 RepID=Q7WY25_PSEAI|nr:MULTISPECIES: DUF2845 domain-containing protein [Pseudomonas]EKA36173.1 hypothetical protein PABE177_4411 [Pseudomonas aeruginosa ATCC 700888]EKA40406.1 hypothetical protein PACI27_4974 [Pseudomonas aeruginosa CI27]EOQ80792.1 hypothetical protein K652_09109 [Pseudomonas aeruginosa VRFPA02]RMJ44327.1 hypothetical protein BFC97_08945 [Pseudomonas aeruginosa 39016]HBU0514999.1 DUF2845 domain-containing protein [Klebsiella pneumoniae]